MTSRNFNPRTREGCDEPLQHFIFYFLYFNPRTREGCDKLLPKATGKTKDFNPRTREGCDAMSFSVPELEDAISIHAPVKGATADSLKALARIVKFQSTHP